MNIFQKLAVKPWSDDAHVDMTVEGGFHATPAKVGLRFFLFVVSVLFFLLTAAYFMRKGMIDWVKLPLPPLLMVNTMVLVAASFALQWAKNSGRDGNLKNLRLGLVLGGVLTIGFLVGQMMVWEDLSALGYFAATNPSNAFFYLFTGLHGLHMVGGLVAWGRATSSAWRSDADVEQLTQRTDLCAAYWHYLLLIWLYVFGLLIIT
ncbi:MAG: cytochrome-c oxidase [Alphaproteobacteria bacterium]|nr:MAG: cytochrome-c oxidase [Alphaproteobacteria bacterium]